LVSVAKGHIRTHAAHKIIGRIERGFDFLGYHFSPAVLTVAKQTIANFIEKASRLYEQKRSAVLAVTALEMYVRRWLRWANGGLVIPRAARHTRTDCSHLGGWREVIGNSKKCLLIDFAGCRSPPPVPDPRVHRRHFDLQRSKSRLHRTPQT
jgi:hypothetical protein